MRGDFIRLLGGDGTAFIGRELELFSVFFSELARDEALQAEREGKGGAGQHKKHKYSKVWMLKNRMTHLIPLCCLLFEFSRNCNAILSKNTYFG